jgi:hypothetical protein
MIYEKNALTINGNIPSFIKPEKIIRKIPRDKPLTKILAPENIIKLLNKESSLHFIKKTKISEHHNSKGIFRFNSICIVSISNLHPVSWSMNTLSKCEQLFLVHSKKQNILEDSSWNTFFLEYGFKGKLRPIYYFQWYDFNESEKTARADFK